MRKKLKKGYFITFEGGEGSGKTTQIKRLAKYIEELGYPITTTKDPGGTFLADMIREIILKKFPQEKLCKKSELLLYLASRAQLINQVIEPALKRKEIVICDRFYDSTRVYQGIARGHEDWVINNLEQFVVETDPNKTILLHVDPRIGLLRSKGREGNIEVRIEDEGLDFHRTVNNGFLELAEVEDGRIHKVITTHLEKDEVELLIRGIFEKEILPEIQEL